MAVRIRGIYATALTALCSTVVQPSPPITERVDEALPVAPADGRIRTTDDRQGIGIHGDPDVVETVVERIEDVGLDTLTWPAPLPAGGVYAGAVRETLRGGALVDLGDGTGFLPFSATERRIDEGDHLRVQVAEPKPPWVDDRPVLETTVRVNGGLASLRRGGSRDADGPAVGDVLPTDPPEGWAPTWHPMADDASLEALDEALAARTDTARQIDAALADGDSPPDTAPAQYWAGDATTWVWFGRASRFALDERRREVTATMPGHHRIKAGAADAGAAVDFVEAVCGAADDGEFPFAATVRQFGPHEGDTVAIGHGKPDGRRLELGPGTVTDRDPDGTVMVEREMHPGGTYDGLGIDRRAGDVAVTEFADGRWWYPTVYRGADGERRGTYVNVCTPVEIFPDVVRYVDLHVDVVRHGDGSVERLDDDELDGAVDAGYVDAALAAKAREIADAVESALATS